MLRFGPETGPVVAVALPLFEEANRVRAFAVAICRALAERGVASALPDMPGQGESALSVADVGLADWRTAFGAAAAGCGASGHRHIVSLRSGALLTHDAAAATRWTFAAIDGADVVRNLVRTAEIAGLDRPPGAVRFDTPGPPILLAGNRIARAMLRDLRDAVADHRSPVRSVRLEGDPRPAGVRVPGTPLWRRAEPGNDPALAALLADDIAEWIAACAG